jgi:RNA polymerase sigma factor (sigma-70 family)
VVQGHSGGDGRWSGLVRAARAGDPGALDTLVAESLPLVYNVVGRALGGACDDVDDVVQETLLRVVTGLGELRDPAAYRSWLVAIAVRQVRDRERGRRDARHRTAGLDDAETLADPAADFTRLTILQLGLADQRREVAEATRWLDGDDRELLALWWLEAGGELSRAALADALGVSARHAAVRVQRLRERLGTARGVVRALAAWTAARTATGAAGAPAPCAGWGELAARWNGVPGSLWRKRFARHLRECAEPGCVAAAEGRVPGAAEGPVPVERLLSGLPLLPVPVALAAQVRHAAAASAQTSAAQTSAAHASAAQASAHAPAARGAGRRHARRARSATRRALLRPTTLIGAAAAGVVGVLVAAHLGTGGPTASAADRTRASTPAGAARTPYAGPSARTVTPSPSRKASASPSASHSARGHAASPSAAARSAPVVKSAAGAGAGGRKGVAVWSFPGASGALAASGAHWYYTWSTTHAGITTPAGTGFVPMIWGAADAGNASELSRAAAEGPYLLGFNEPDMPSQSNMTVDQALSLWPKLEKAGKVLGSPAVAYDGDKAGSWLDRFMAGAQQRGYRVDFITLHWYGGDFTTSEAVTQLRTYLQAVYDRYHKPIWLTEYALIDFSDGTRYPTSAQQSAFVTASARMLDSLSYVRRYAWFGLGTADSGPSSALFGPGGKTTDSARAYEATP